MPECEEAYTNREEKEETEMKVLKKITDFVSRYMAAIVILMALVALFAPSTVSFIKTSYVNTLLGIVMFGMGLTLKPGKSRRAQSCSGCRGCSEGKCH